MSDDLNAIGFFQFDNLVRSRVPFLLFHEPIDFSEVYDGMELEHLQRYAFPIQEDFEQTFDQLLTMKIDRRMPVVVMLNSTFPDGEFLSRLEEEGFMNVHGVEGGWDEILREAKASF